MDNGGIEGGESVYGYIRVSTPSQEVKGYGLETQKAEIVNYCKNNNLNLIHIFEDRGITGAASDTDEDEDVISKRDGLLQLLSVANKIKIVVMNTSRLWRSDISKVLIRRELARKDCDVISIEQPRYTIYKREPSEVLINGMIELLDEYERLHIALKLAKGRTTKAHKGDKPAGAVPFGYKYSLNKKYIEICEPESIVVKRMFSMSQTGKTVQSIVDTLNSDGILTRRGKPWAKSTVHNILKNKFYTGELMHQKTLLRGNHTPLISKIQFGKVNSQLIKRHK
jgi:DNA invertase Pin-like site-specific DNA recombinase